MRSFLPVLLAVLWTGCATHVAGLRESGPIPQEPLYSLNENEAFLQAHTAMLRVIPNAELADDPGPTRGHNLSFKVVFDEQVQRVLAIPTVTTDDDGHRVRAYRFEVVQAR